MDKGIVTKYVFATISLLHLLGQFFDIQLLSTFTKPLLMPVLILFFIFTIGISNLNSHKELPFIISALVFSFLGDVLLMKADLNPLYFMAGLGAFLLTHIFYIITFQVLYRKYGVSPIPSIFGIGIVALYLIIFLSWLYPFLPAPMRFPVIFYALVIALMLINSFNIRHIIVYPYSLWIIMGTALFVLSDSLIAVNKFIVSLPQSGILIMSSYILAQYLIIVSLLNSLHSLPSRE